MIITAVVSRKGGVGKSATVQALGTGLARQGYNVLMVDLDSQANLTYATGCSGGQFDSMDVLRGNATMAQAIQSTENGDVLPGSDALATADVIIDGTGKEYRLREALEPIKGIYDYIIIDTPAALNVLTVNALTAANDAIIPVQADYFSLQGLDKLNATIQTVKKYCNPTLSINGILVTRYDKRNIISRDMWGNISEAAEQIGTKLYRTPVRECVSIKEAQALRESIYAYAPRSNAAKDYKAFVAEYLEQ